MRFRNIRPALAAVSLMSGVCICAVLSLKGRAQPPITIPITYDVPSDIPGGADKATLQDAAIFAWREFIALNWPALAGSRDEPDPKRAFGDLNGPGVWQTARGKVEIYPGNGGATVPPHGYKLPAKGTKPRDDGYSDPPKYVYSGGEIPPCRGQARINQPSWINLDETSQIGLDFMYAGRSPRDQRLIRFLAKANHVEYKYVVSNEFWYQSGNLSTAEANFKSALNSVPRSFPNEPYVHFPNGTIEFKAAWRKLGPQDDPGRFYQTRVRYYEAVTEKSQCYREDIWALVALHIIQKTPTAPSFIYATFEQVDNVVPPAAPASGPTKPLLHYRPQDSHNAPAVTAVGKYCTDPGQQIYYRNINNTNAKHPGLPSDGNICINERDRPIPPAVDEVNRAAQNAIVAYTRSKGFSNTPWQYYRLVNVQAQPFDKSKINHDLRDPDNVHNPSTFYQANIVVETNYTLQNFSGRISDGKGAGAPTDYPNGPVAPPNVVTFLNKRVQTYNMGGCMGCHGVVQTAVGTDFSFILAGNTVKTPDTPDTPASDLIAKYSLYK